MKTEKKKEGIISRIILEVLLKDKVEEIVKKAIAENDKKWKKKILSNPDIHKIFKLSETELLDTINRMFDGDGLMDEEESKGFSGISEKASLLEIKEPKWFPVMSEERLVDISLLEKNVSINPKALIEIAEADPENYYYDVEKGILYGKTEISEDDYKILMRGKK